MINSPIQNKNLVNPIYEYLYYVAGIPMKNYYELVTSIYKRAPFFHIAAFVFIGTGDKEVIRADKTCMIA